MYLSTDDALLTPSSRAMPVDTDAWLLVKVSADRKQGDLSMLLKSRADPNVMVNVEWRNFATTPLFEASVSGHTRIARMLLSAGADVNTPVGPGYTPLYNAAYNGHGETVRLLAEAHADVNASTDDHFSPLYIACQEGHVRCVDALIAHGAAVDSSRPDEGATALYIASQNGHAYCVQSLLGGGVTIDKPMFDGSTPLMIACYFAHARVVELLLRAGASLSLRDKRGHNALVWAQRGNDALVVALVQEERAARVAARRLRGGPFDWGDEGGPFGWGGDAGDGDGDYGEHSGEGGGMFGGLRRALGCCLKPPVPLSSDYGPDSPTIGVGMPRQHKVEHEPAPAISSGGGCCRCCLPTPVPT